MQPVFLTVEDVLSLHDAALQKFGGAQGVRDIGLLESAVAMPQAGFGDQYLHTDLFEMAAAYLFHIAKNRPFVDGNKRSSLFSAEVFLRLNDLQVTASDDDLVELTVRVAAGKASKSDAAVFLRKHSRKAS